MRRSITWFSATIKITTEKQKGHRAFAGRPWFSFFWSYCAARLFSFVRPCILLGYDGILHGEEANQSRRRAVAASVVLVWVVRVRIGRFPCYLAP